MKNNRTKLFALLACIALSMMLGLAACGQNAGSSASSAAGSSSAASASAASSESSDLFGSPWIISTESGNLPAEKPSVKDDLYTHYNYDYIAAHQGQNASVMSDVSTEPKNAIIDIVKDGSKSGHDLEQLRIFFNQAADWDTLKQTGLSEVQPYLDRIDAVTSIDEMNALLLSDDFPFSPWITSTIGVYDMHGENIVTIYPNCLFTMVEAQGSDFYRTGEEWEDPTQAAKTEEEKKNEEQLFAVTLMLLFAPTSTDLISSGMSEEEAIGQYEPLFQFEKSYAQYAESTTAMLKEDFGAYSKQLAESVYTLDELCAKCPNFPLKETLQKVGKGSASQYMAASAKWLEVFNGLWTAENLDTIKLMTKCRVLNETRPYRDPSALYAQMAPSEVPSPEDFAYDACSNINTLAQVVGKTYVVETLGAKAKERLTKLTQDLVAEYKSLVSETTWMGDSSKSRVIEKLDHMALNVIEPVDGYFDYSALELTPTEEGGTLFSNYLKLKQYRLDRESELIGKPATASMMWYVMAPTTYNAFYEPVTNSINIVPGFVTSLSYSDDMSDTELLAGIGFVIGHEISHGFDYQGAQVDAYGQPSPVFADEDVAAYVAKRQALMDYYAGIELVPGVKIDTEMISGEAAADLCGMQAVMALADKIDGIDYDSFFNAVAGQWAIVKNVGGTAASMSSDPHPQNILRVNVNVQMFDTMYKGLGVSEGDGMYLAPDKRIAIWGSQTKTGSAASSSSASASSAASKSSSAASQSSAASSSAAASSSSASSAADDGQNPIMNFIGKYGADRAIITIDPSGRSDAEIVVEWPSSAAEGSIWTMSGTFDTNTLTVNYTNCVKIDYVYEGEGEEDRTETVAYTDGKGSITFDGGSGLTWNDGQEHVADGVKFTWAL